MPQPLRRTASAGLVRKAFGATTEPVGERQIRVRISTGQVDRAGDVVVQKGIRFDNFQKSRTVLWNHDQDHPVAQCLSIDPDAAGDLEALTQFPDAGVSPKSDEVYGLLKAGVINAASIGFLPVDVEPMDGKNPRKGLRIATSELLEFSFVSVPANPGAEVVLRAFREAGARKDAPAMSRKGLYMVSQLAYILHELGYQVDAAIEERAREGDASSVPEQLHAALAQLGAALVAMTTEEVAELLAERGTGLVDPEGDLELGDNVVLLSMLRGTYKTLQPTSQKAGRKFSAETAAAMRGHLQSIGAGHQAMSDMLDEADPEDEPPCARAMRLRLLRLGPSVHAGGL